ncbi:MAG: LPS assembly lipoprotein LptE [Deltaproteobacteria bacterium]|jgi:hypothetical protein|nr:LPS assembly lipoprotein LptE [Deltaproteobacteria bacterium]
MKLSPPSARPAHAGTLLCLAVLLAAPFFSSCGYQFNASSYSLDREGSPLRLSVPVAENRSRYARLGPALTREVIERLSGGQGFVVSSAAPEAKLALTITSVVVGSGSWDVVGRYANDVPEASSSRTASVTVNATLTKDDPGGGPPKTAQSSFSSSRSYVVSPNQGQVEMQEAEALDWIIDDISEKIGLVLFNEF